MARMESTSFLDLIMTGQYLPAVGIALVVIVGVARKLLAARWSWFGSKVGGYVLGFGSSVLLYFGAALEAGQTPSVGIAAASLAAGLAASGGFETMLDILGALKKPPPSGGNVAIVVLAFALVASCSKLEHVGNVGKEIVVDCTKTEAVRASSELGPLVDGLLYSHADSTGRIDWAPLKDAAKRWSVELGGCVLADAVSRVLRPPAPDPNAPQLSPVMLDLADLRAGFALFKAQHFGGVVFVVKNGEQL